VEVIEVCCYGGGVVEIGLLNPDAVRTLYRSSMAADP